MDHVKLIGVIGAGQMGAGIAQVAATSQFEVVVIDVSEDALKRGFSTIESSLQRLAERRKLLEDAATIRKRVRGFTTLDALQSADFIIEAVSENLQLKIDILRTAESHAKPSAIITSNTSSISITRLAAALSHPERVAGMHFMNPVPIMPLVELIAGLQTSPETMETTRNIAKRMGKRTVQADDQPGFIVNRILMPMVNEAIGALAEGLGTKEDIDAAMKLGTNQPMGPLELADFIGLDTCLAILEVLHDGIGDPRYRPASLLRRYVAAGWLGRKTGRGFYSYPEK